MSTMPKTTIRTKEQMQAARERDERITEWCLTAESEDFAASQKEAIR
jgi:hypothetical protein